MSTSGRAGAICPLVLEARLLLGLEEWEGGDLGLSHRAGVRTQVSVFSVQYF